MDEDQNSDLSEDQLGHSVGISQSVVATVAVEEGQSQEQLEVNFHEGIQHSETKWALSSLEYERTSPSHIKTSFVLGVDKLFPKFDDGLGKCRLSFCIYMYNCYFIGHWI